RSEGGEVDEAVENGRCTVDRSRRLVPPELVTRRRVVCDQMTVVRADDHLAPPDGGGGVDVRPGVPRPQEVSGPRAERVQGAVCVPDVDAAIRECRRRVEVLASVEKLRVSAR